jgi:glycerol-3-phosphate O-acyltransferase
VIGISLKFFLRNLFLMVRGRWYRFGYACVNFGSPLSMKEYSHRKGVDFRGMEREERFSKVKELAGELMAAVGKVIPVLPVSLVATAFLNQQENRLSELDLKAEVHRLLAALSAAGAHIYIPRKDQDYAANVGLRMLTLRHIVKEEEGLFTADPANIPLLQYYANSIRHLAPAPPSPVGH